MDRRPRPAALPAALFAAFVAGAPAAWSTRALAQDTPPEASPSADGSARIGDAPPGERLRFTPEWRVRIEPSIGFFAFSGDLTLPAAGADAFNVEDINLDRGKLGPYAEVHLARNRWRLSFSGLSLSVEGESRAPFTGQLGAIAVTPATRLDSELTYITGSFRAGYRVWSWVSGTDARGERDLAVGVDLLAGLRVHDVDTQTAVVGAPGRAEADETFVDIIGGVAFELDWKRTLGFDIYAAGGGLSTGDRTSRSFDLGIGFNYRPIPAVGAQVGYRLIAFNLENGDGNDTFEYDGAVAGIYWGLQLSF